ncbi:hypothetical protein CVT24_012701 [Panaeolus cyanescens]|uniref:G domain-containing protein n=1 Tax=Panaeolus cyanescens TaxID=181874 RepID=A0A409YK78_9AGAR|nr:hypothetical protein CVT24_012701 [Panaeolus cyanescens]
MVNPETVDTSELKVNDIIIAIMGPTGSGKSNFIDVLTEHKERRAGATLTSCTTEIQAIRIHSSNKALGDRLVLVDTPGFDDTNKTDVEILKMIGKWLERTYNADIKLSGILYLHRITDNRMSGSPHRNLRMFGQLCGDQASRNVILITTMWDNIEIEVGLRREKELREKFWKMMLKHGSITERFDNREASAWRIVNSILTRSDTAKDILLLQEELVELRKNLNETSAGVTLYHTLQQLIAEHKATFAQYTRESNTNNDPVLAMQLENQCQKIQAELDKTLTDIKHLKVPIGRRFMLLFSKRSRSHSLSLV